MDRGLAAATGMGFVGFIARQNHWWQTPEMPQALRAATEHLTQGQDIMLFGRSMGSAGALLAARSLPVSTVLAVAPPIIVDEQHASWELRFQTVAHLARQIHGLEPYTDPRTRTYVAYDPFRRDDVNYLQLPDAAGRTYVRWPVPLSDHRPMVDVWKAGLYRNLPPHSSSGATCRPHGRSCAGRAHAVA
ncbi:hypothetical protein [Paracoccus indicus]|uniref:hypothetical protein n=1 Tax=Paracoccus indicus TaxID=2079229 RepID=UPI000D33FFDC|nr:hypothetical protein [Paracoccus indicus]